LIAPSRLLAGTRIIEMAALGPVPFGGMMLADMGADVIRVDRAAEAVSSSAYEGMDRSPINRGCRSIGLDLRSSEGLRIARELIKSADVLLEGFRPGVMERLGLGPGECLALKPSLVYARTTGWGQEGPMAQAAGHDINYIALSGVLSAFTRQGGQPTAPLNLLGDYGGGGMMLAFAVACSLFAASATGEGTVLDVAMVDGVASMTSQVLARKAMGQWREPGTNFLDTGSHWYDTFETSDGRYMAVGAIEALEGANRKAQVVGINGSKEAVELIKSGKLLASGDFNGFIQGCIGTEIAVRNLHKEPTPKEVMLKPIVIDKSNSAPYEVPVEKRTCPTLQSLAAK